MPFPPDGDRGGPPMNMGLDFPYVHAELDLVTMVGGGLLCAPNLLLNTLFSMGTPNQPGWSSPWQYCLAAAGYDVPGRAITETDIVQFLNLSRNLEPQFTNREFYEKEWIYQRLASPGGLTFTIMTGLFTHLGLISGRPSCSRAGNSAARSQVSPLWAMQT